VPNVEEISIIHPKECTFISKGMILSLEYAAKSKFHPLKMGE